MPVRAPRLRDIAERAGCSVSVVSAVLNGARGNTGVGEPLRQQIQALAAELGYEPRFAAQALRTQRSDTIGLVVGSWFADRVSAGFWGPVLEGVDAAVRAAGRDLLIVGPAAGEDELDRGARYLRQGKVDALVVVGLMYGERVAALPPGRVAVVYGEGRSGLAEVDLDEAPGILDLARHLSQEGHRGLLWVGLTVRGERQAAERWELLRAACAAERIRCHEHWLEVGPGESALPLEAGVAIWRRQLAEPLRGPRRWTAMVAYNERVALGVYAALADAGLRVPTDVAVAAFDDLRADAMLPPLTVVSLRLRALGEAAGRRALALAEGEAVPATGVERLPAWLVVRESTLG